MKISIVVWKTDHKVVRITEGGINTLTVIKDTDKSARIELYCGDIPLDIAEAKSTAKALNLAAKVTWYLDNLEPDEALDTIEGLPTTPYDGWRPMPRAGRTENP